MVTHWDLGGWAVHARGATGRGPLTWPPPAPWTKPVSWPTALGIDLWGSAGLGKPSSGRMGFFFSADKTLRCSKRLTLWAGVRNPGQQGRGEPVAAYKSARCSRRGSGRAGQKEPRSGPIAEKPGAKWPVIRAGTKTATCSDVVVLG